MQKHRAPIPAAPTKAQGAHSTGTGAAAAERVEEWEHHCSEDGGEGEKRSGDSGPESDREGLGPVELQDTPPSRAESAQFTNVGPPAPNDVAHHQCDKEEEGERGRGCEGDQGQACREALALYRLEESGQAGYGGVAGQGFGEV